MGGSKVNELMCTAAYIKNNARRHNFARQYKLNVRMGLFVYGRSSRYENLRMWQLLRSLHSRLSSAHGWGGVTITACAAWSRRAMHGGLKICHMPHGLARPRLSSKSLRRLTRKLARVMHLRLLLPPVSSLPSPGNHTRLTSKYTLKCPTSAK